MEWYSDLKGAAQWIWHSEDRLRQDLALFHGKLVPPAGATHVELHVSADNRYALYAVAEGGTRAASVIGRGPARADVQHKSLDPYALEIASGRAVHIYAQVRWMPGQPEAPMGEMHTSQPGFLLAAIFYDEAGRIVGKTGTGKDWLAARCQGIGLEPMPKDIGFLCIGMLEHQRASGWPADWLSPAGVSEGGAWKRASVGPAPYYKADPDMCWSPNDRPWLLPRQIAHCESREARPFTTWAEAAGTRSQLPGEPFPLRLGADESRRVLLDMGEMVLAYPSVQVSGKGTKVTLTYAEVLTRKNAEGHNEKSFDPASGFAPFGYSDCFELDIDDARTMALSHWRSFRFVLVEVTAGDAGGTVEAVNFEATGYPFENASRFEADGEHAGTIAKFVDVSWRTLKCCTWETYMDCPFYEQMQYVGDTRLQCLITYVTTADPTLPAQALRAFDRSRIYEGITQSRYPSSGMQLIPTFSLIYISMIEDYLEWVGDEGLVAELRPGIAPIINWFSQFVDHETGLVTMPTYWPFVDWVAGWDKGIPPSAPNRDGRGVSAIINLQMVMALEAASRIYERAKPGSGNLYFTRANVLRQKIYDTFYHSPTGLIADIPVDDKGSPAYRVAGGAHTTLSFSQHAQALAVLTDVLKATEAKRALGWAMDGEHLAPIGPKTKGAAQTEAANRELAGRPAQFRMYPASFYFRFYLAEALAKAGMGGEFWGLLGPFFEALARGSTTWPEAFEPCRSECHAWSSWPVYFFHRHVLGVNPPDSGDGGVTVSPLRCEPLEKVRGVTATYRGPVEVEVDWTGGEAKVEARGAGVRVRRHGAG